jgi:hypothetical protein
MLNEAATIYAERNAKYKDNYKLVGKMYLQLFPNGLSLRTPGDFNRMAILMQIVNKVTRYAANFYDGGHDDSLDDISVYSMMLRELDGEEKQASKHPFLHEPAPDWAVPAPEPEPEPPCVGGGTYGGPYGGPSAIAGRPIGGTQAAPAPVAARPIGGTQAAPVPAGFVHRARAECELPAPECELPGLRRTWQ